LKKRTVTVDKSVIGALRETIQLYRAEYKNYLNGIITDKMLANQQTLDHEMLSDLFLHTEAEHWLRKRIEKAQDKKEYYNLKLALISCLEKQSKYEEAKREAESLMTEQLHKEDEYLFSCLLVLKGVVECQLKNYDESIKQYKRALKLKLQLGASRIKISTVYQNLGIAY